MNGKKGYVWLVTAGDATYLVAAPSRVAAVLDMHFGRLLGIPAVSDGYATYDIFPVRQRCWMHSNRIKDPEKPISGFYSLFYLSCLAYGGIQRRTGSECTDFANLIAICEISFSGSLIRLLCTSCAGPRNTR